MAAMDWERNSAPAETVVVCLSEELSQRAIFAVKLIPIDRKQPPEANLNCGINLQIALTSISLHPIHCISYRNVRLSTRRRAVKCSRSEVGDSLQPVSQGDAPEQNGKLPCVSDVTDFSERNVEVFHPIEHLSTEPCGSANPGTRSCNALRVCAIECEAQRRGRCGARLQTSHQQIFRFKKLIHSSLAALPTKAGFLHTAERG